MLALAVEAARRADAIFLLVGKTSDPSVESNDRADTRRPTVQETLIALACAANSCTAVIVNVGYAFDFGWQDRAAAVLSV